MVSSDSRSPWNQSTANAGTGGKSLSTSTLSEGVGHPKPSRAMGGPLSGVREVGFSDRKDPGKGAKQSQGTYRSQLRAHKLGQLITQNPSNSVLEDLQRENL